MRRQTRKALESHKYSLGALVTAGLLGGIAAGIMLRRRRQNQRDYGRLDERIADDEGESLAGMQPNRVPDVEPLQPQQPY